MSYWGISGIRMDASTSEVKSCLVHEIEKVGVEFYTKSGNEKSFEDVANRIAAGDIVHVLIKDDRGNFAKGEKVSVKPGQVEYLTSHPDNLLFELPRF